MPVWSKPIKHIRVMSRYRGKWRREWGLVHVYGKLKLDAKFWMTIVIVGRHSVKDGCMMVMLQLHNVSKTMSYSVVPCALAKASSIWSSSFWSIVEDAMHCNTTVLFHSENQTRPSHHSWWDFKVCTTRAKHASTATASFGSCYRKLSNIKVQTKHVQAHKITSWTYFL